jgi:hypothetical protein
MWCTAIDGMNVSWWNTVCVWVRGHPERLVVVCMMHHDSPMADSNRFLEVAQQIEQRFSRQTTLDLAGCWVLCRHPRHLDGSNVIQQRFMQTQIVTP